MKFFERDEFKCPCCGENKISGALTHKLDDARFAAGKPFIISSGYRCEKHNAEVGGSPTSSHLLGLAADIVVQDDRIRLYILKGLIDTGFDRIGVSGDFIHADIDPDKPRPRIWPY